MNPCTQLWQGIERSRGLPSTEITWRERLGDAYALAQPLLRPTGELASAYPCTVEFGCEYPHNVIIYAPDDIVAACGCELDCETIDLQRSDIVLYEMDRARLDGMVSAAMGLARETDTNGLPRGTTRLGTHSPYAGFRFPVYLTVQSDVEDFEKTVNDALARDAAPFIMLAPTRGFASSDMEGRLAARKSTFLALDEILHANGGGGFELSLPLDQVLRQFHAANLPDSEDAPPIPFFPTPPDAKWSDVSIKFRDGHTVSVNAGEHSGVFHYAHMGMASKRNGNPTVQWELLHAFADGHGHLDWSSRAADRRNQKRRELLAANLKSFFRIEGDPFRLTEDGKGWEARFEIEPDG